MTMVSYKKIYSCITFEVLNTKPQTYVTNFLSLLILMTFFFDEGAAVLSIPGSTSLPSGAPFSADLTGPEA